MPLITSELFFSICRKDPEDITDEEFKIVRDWAYYIYGECLRSSQETNTSVVDCLVKHITCNELKDLFWATSTCNCCLRHKSNVPVSILSKKTTPKVDGCKCPNCPCSCKCTCRMTLRDFYLAYHLKKNNETRKK
jgi:hypothetical protein